MAEKILNSTMFAGKEFEMTTEQIKNVVSDHYNLYRDVYGNMIGHPHPMQVEDISRECFLDDALVKSLADAFHRNDTALYENYLAIIMAKLRRKERDGYIVDPLYEAVEALYEEVCAIVRGFY